MGVIKYVEVFNLLISSDIASEGRHQGGGNPNKPAATFSSIPMSVASSLI